MADVAQLDRTYDFIMKRLVADGRAPHYTEIAAGLGVAPDVGLGLLRELMALGMPNWLHPNTDLIASFPPFQCGLEGLGACWAFPGRDVTVEAPCLDCGEPLEVTVRDGAIQRARPASVRFYVLLPVREWRANLPYA